MSRTILQRLQTLVAYKLIIFLAVRKLRQLLKSSLNYFYSQLIKDYIAAELDESTNEYSWALNKANWIRDSNKYPDDLLTAKDKDDLINIKTTNRYFYD